MRKLFCFSRVIEGDAVIEHVKGPDIVSDGIPMGAVQILGQGLPIVMMANHQTTGGYVKIGVVHAFDVARLSQRVPGAAVRFTQISQEEGIEISRREAAALKALQKYVTESAVAAAKAFRGLGRRASGAMKVRVDGVEHTVTWERLS